MPLVEKIVAPFECISARSEIHRWANYANAAQGFRSGVTEFARHLCDQIPSHRVANEENLLESVHVGQFLEDRFVISAHSGVVQRWRERFRAAAIPLI